MFIQLAKDVISRTLKTEGQRWENYFYRPQTAQPQTAEFVF